MYNIGAAQEQYCNSRKEGLKEGRVETKIFVFIYLTAFSYLSLLNTRVDQKNRVRRVGAVRRMGDRHLLGKVGARAKIMDFSFECTIRTSCRHCQWKSDKNRKKEKTKLPSNRRDKKSNKNVKMQRKCKNSN